MRLFSVIFLCVLVLAGCQAERPLSLPTPTSQTQPAPALATAAHTPTAEPPTPTAVPSQTPIPPATATATTVPSPTPKPVVSLFLPAAWQAIADTIVTELNAAHPATDWVLSSSEPSAQISLVNQEGGLPVHQEPLALVVPFNTNWDNTDQLTAQGIIDQGHGLVKVMPWSHIHPAQKSLRIDGRFPADADYPFHTTWSLAVQPGAEEAAAAAAPIFQQALADPVVHLAAVGDIMLDRTLGSVIADGGIEFPFRLVADSLQPADITVGNLETALGDTGEPVVKSYTFQSPPGAAESLAWGGFDVVSLANNHALDYGPESLLQGIDLLKAQNVAPIGAGINAAAARAPHIINVNGYDVAFLGYVHVPVEARGVYFDTATWTATETEPGLAWAVPEEIKEDVTAVLPQADLVVVVLHSGYEYVEPPSEEQTAAAQAAIDAGADIVIGHHAHILQAVQFYKDGIIFYGLGNFAFNIDGNPDTAILNVWLDKAGVRQFEFIPAIVQYGGQPRLADPTEAADIRARIYRLSQGFPAPVVTNPR
ncbi:MAG: CapA family protein [Chloroflexota bacterium]